MMRLLTLCLFLWPFLLSAQDYTRETKEENHDAEEQVASSEREARLLILPYHPHKHISEVDRMMTPATMDVQTMRSRLRKELNRALTQAFSDSLDAVDLSIEGLEEDIDIQEYMYNALDYRYIKWEAEEENPKRARMLRLPKRKKEEKVYGAQSKKENGQLKREEILHDRYMSASVGNKGAVDYMQDVYGFDHLLVVTQLEITRNHDTPATDDYISSIHLELIDAQGNSVKGLKQSLPLTAKALGYDEFRKKTLPRFASMIVANLWTHLQSQEGVSEENADY